MKKIENDVAILKLQGYEPHVWLEFINNDGEITYFDGICAFDDIDDIGFITEGNPIYIHIQDIENFTVGSLSALRELNICFYDRSATYVLSENGDNIIVEVDTVYIYENYATIIQDALRGFDEGFDIPLYVSVDQIRFTPAMNEDEYDGEEITVHYKDFLHTYFEDIYKPRLNDDTVYGVLDDGTHYFIPKVLTMEDKRVAYEACFYPNTFELEDKGRVYLTDTRTGLGSSYDLSSDFATLMKYSSDLEGLSEVMAEFLVKVTASELSGSDVYDNCTYKYKRYDSQYKVEKYMSSKCSYYFDLPKNYFLSFTYLSMVEPNLDIIDLEDEEEYIYIKNAVSYQTPLNCIADATICDHNGIYYVKPLFVESIEFKEGKLSVIVRCIVKAPSCGYLIIGLPLHLLDSHTQTEEVNGVQYSMELGDLFVPFYCFRYLDTTKTFEEILKEQGISGTNARAYTSCGQVTSRY